MITIIHYLIYQFQPVGSSVDRLQCKRGCKVTAKLRGATAAFGLLLTPTPTAVRVAHVRKRGRETRRIYSTSLVCYMGHGGLTA